MCGSIHGPSSWGWVHFGRKSLITLTVHLARAHWYWYAKGSPLRGVGDHTSFVPFAGTNFLGDLTKIQPTADRVAQNRDSFFKLCQRTRIVPMGFMISTT